MTKKGFLNPINLITGIVFIIAGILFIFGIVNLASVLGGIGFLIQAIKIVLEKGL